MLGKKPKSSRLWQSLPKQSTRVAVLALLVSVLVHLGSGWRLTRSGRSRHPMVHNQLDKQVKIKLVEQPKAKKKKDDRIDPANSPKVLEMPQVKTERPDEASYVGHVDHKTKKETRVSEKQKRDTAKDPGQKGRPDALAKQPVNPALPNQLKPQIQPTPQQRIEVQGKTGSLSFNSLHPKPRNQYEALLPTNIQDLPGQLNSGFQDYVDDKVAEGDRIDMNTTEYRYIGYFTTMRKAIELVWTYPLDAARRGMQGEVGLEFWIGKDGKTSRIRVVKSSGYEQLDRAIIEAIKLASPFSPLPPGFRQQRLVVTGSFRYVLTGMGAH